MKYLIFILILFSCSNDESPEIETITVNGKYWMKENVSGYYSWDDAASVCPNGFRLPSKDEYLTMISLGNNVIYQKLGYQDSDGTTWLKGQYGYYWTSTPQNAGSWAFVFNDSDMFVSGYDRSKKMCVRCVKK